MTFEPPAAAKIGCVWRKTNLTQSGCPITFRRDIIPVGYKSEKLD
jgi:hypothetical protein